MDHHPERPPDILTTTTVDDVPVHCYRSYARRIHRILYLGGVLQVRSVVQSYVIGILVIFMCFSQVVFVINFCRDYSDNLMIVSKCFGLASSIFTPVLMSCCFLVKRKKLLKLHKTLNDLFEQELARDQRTKTTMLASLYTFARPSYVLSFMLGFTILSYVLPSVINVIIRPVIFRSAIAVRYKWPYPVKFPWSVPSSGPLFYLQYLYQVLSSWWMVFTIAAVDNLFGFYTFQISSILHAMSARLMSPQPDDVFLVVLKTCTETYQQLLQSVRLLEDVYGIIILRMILANAVLMCALIFEVYPFTDMTVNQFCSFGSFMVMKLLQTFIYAWYGSLVTSASEHFREGIYFSEWSNSKLDCHVRVGVVVTMLQKPIVITALKVSSVNVNMFINVSV
ncbi:Putative odorant receptor 13a [Harpegnathos saltator]|uniref:Odorant receptor n=1 Tax=Harpegnathos saltator TaxID=610380 RepID=E2BXG4_HARSA|nr:Putative odorant receptor 13a [Harpegnathos saltator]